jgi:hypothetical protein
MNFDFGEVISRSFQIAWKHKILWAFSALPMLLSFLIFPVMFVPIFFMENRSFGDPSFVENPLIILAIVLFSIVISIISYALYGVASSSVILGVVRADEGAERFTFNELLNDSRPYWWRVLGVMLLIGLGISLVFFVIFGCFSLLGAATMGIGFICLQPLILLMYPLMLILYGVIEESQVAVVVENLGVMDAIKRGWELVRANFWRIVLISLIVYFGLGIVSSIIMVPFMAPMFAFPFFMGNGQFEPTPRTMALFMGGFGCIFFPIMAFVQSIVLTFMKSTYTITYLRLTKQQGNTSAVLEVNE